MVFAAEGSSYFVKGTVGHGTAEEHGKLSRLGDVFWPFLGSEISDTDVKISGHGALDDVHGDVLVGSVFLQAFLRQLDGDGLVLKGSVNAEPGQNAFYFPDVILDLFSQEAADVVADVEAERKALVLDDGEPGLEIRRLNVRDHAPFETGDEPFGDILQILRGFVAGHDDLAFVGIEILEEIEEFFLSLIDQGKMLNVIYQDGVVVGAVFFPEIMDVVPEGKGSLEIRTEILAGDVKDPFAVVPL